MNKAEVCIVTGATGGMGKALTSALCQAGMPVVMACRNLPTAQQFARSLPTLPDSPFPLAIPLDLASFKSVRHFAETIRNRGYRVKTLIHNAGTLNQRMMLTEDRLEQMTQVNYVSPYLLTRLLLPLMPTGSRIVCTSSCTWRLGSVKDDFFRRGIEHFRMFRAYGSSKLAVLSFTAELARRCRSRGIAVHAADPGVVNTGMITMHRWFDPLTDLFFRPFIKTARQGASTALFLACSEEAGNQSGKFWKNKRPCPMPAFAENQEQGRRLWEATEQKVSPFLFPLLSQG